MNQSSDLEYVDKKVMFWGTRQRAEINSYIINGKTDPF
jgi:hypothetical protein